MVYNHCSRLLKDSSIPSSILERLSPLVALGKTHLKMLESMRSEVFKIRALLLTQRHLLYAYDELEMASMGLQIREKGEIDLHKVYISVLTPFFKLRESVSLIVVFIVLCTDEQVTSQERVFRLLPEEIPAFNLNFSMERRTSEEELKVLRGQLRYLTGLQVVQSLQTEGSRGLIGQKQGVMCTKT